MRAGTEREELIYMRREGSLSDEFNRYLDRNIELIEVLDEKIFAQAARIKELEARPYPIDAIPGKDYDEALDRIAELEAENNELSQICSTRDKRTKELTIRVLELERQVEMLCS